VSWRFDAVQTKGREVRKQVVAQPGSVSSGRPAVRDDPVRFSLRGRSPSFEFAYDCSD